jgi:alanyl-tRNA synthetase
MELCGGTHVAAGIRRIEAVAGPAVLAYLNERDVVVKQLGERFKAQPGEIVELVSALQEEHKASGKALAAARGELALAKASALAGQAQALGEFQLLVVRLDGVEGAGLQSAAQGLADQLGAGAAVVLGGLPDPADLAKAGAFIGGVVQPCGGGRRPSLAGAMAWRHSDNFL